MRFVVVFLLLSQLAFAMTEKQVVTALVDEGHSFHTSEFIETPASNSPWTVQLPDGSNVDCFQQRSSTMFRINSQYVNTFEKWNACVAEYITPSASIYFSREPAGGSTNPIDQTLFAVLLAGILAAEMARAL